MRLTLNLASRAYVELRPLYQRLRVLALLLLVTAALFWWVLRAEKTRATDAAARATSLQTSISDARMERQQSEEAMRQPENAAVLTRAQFLNNLYLRKSFSWTAVMMDLERVLPAGVQVLNIDPVVGKDGTVTIRMRVAGPRERAVTLVRNLEGSRRFRAPRIVGETSQTQTGPNANLQPASGNNSVNFDVLADYNPLPPRDTKSIEREGADAAAAPPKPHRVGRTQKPEPDRKTP
jgi:type IV pilus assembly protein PilN